jgi:hypothetical protein
MRRNLNYSHVQQFKNRQSKLEQETIQKETSHMVFVNTFRTDENCKPKNMKIVMHPFQMSKEYLKIVPTTNKTQHVSTTTIGCLTLRKQSLFIHRIIRNTQIHGGQIAGILNVKVGGTHSYHCTSNRWTKGCCQLPTSSSQTIENQSRRLTCFHTTQT